MFEPERFGKYMLLDKIATGGMAEVYKAKSYGVMGFEKLLVIKKILPHLSRNKEFVSMFINEAKVSVSMKRSNQLTALALAAQRSAGELEVKLAKK